MSIATAVAPHLPYLRRFARALTGSQTSGDAYVVAVLEAFIEDPNAFARDLPARIALYRAFLKVWDSIPLNTEGNDAPADETDSADCNLDVITPRPRQAFLLMALEGFSLAEAAQVLDLPVAGGQGADRSGGRGDRRADRRRHPDHRGRASDRHGSGERW